MEAPVKASTKVLHDSSKSSDARGVPSSARTGAYQYPTALGVELVSPSGPTSASTRQRLEVPAASYGLVRITVRIPKPALGRALRSGALDLGLTWVEAHRAWDAGPLLSRSPENNLWDKPFSAKGVIDRSP